LRATFTIAPRELGVLLTPGKDVYPSIRNPAAFARGQGRAGLRLSAYVLPRLLARRYPEPIDRFY
jgi:hypothetical protein